MPSAFPGLIEWNSNYSVDVPSIDNQHQQLVAIIRRLQEAMLDNGTRKVLAPLFSDMRQYAKYHFAFEEQLLKEHGYPNLELHRSQHVALAAKLQELEEKYTAGGLKAGAPLMQFLRSWLLDHICANDKDYATFLKEKNAT